MRLCLRRILLLSALPVVLTLPCYAQWTSVAASDKPASEPLAMLHPGPQEATGGAANLDEGANTGDETYFDSSARKWKARASRVIDVRNIAGADCTGTTDSSAALNKLTSTQDTSASKTISFRGCPLVRLQSQWLIHGQEHIEIDLGNTINTMSSAGSQGNTIIFGCGGSAGAVVRFDRSGYTLIHGGAITAKGPNCGSNFTRSLEYTNTGAGGYTSTSNTARDIWLTTSNRGGGITNYAGIYINGIPNQEEFKFYNVHIHCQFSKNSYGVWLNDANADNTTFSHGAVGACYHGFHVDAGALRVDHSDVSNNGNYSIFGAGGAQIYGPVDEFAYNVAGDGSGTLQIPNSGNQAGGFFAYNGVATSNLTSNDPTQYFINLGRNSTLYLLRNGFGFFNDFSGTACSTIKNSTIVGNDLNGDNGPQGTVIDLGGNSWGAGCTLISQTVQFQNESGASQGFQTFLEPTPFWGTAGTNAGWALMPTYQATTGAKNLASAPLSWLSSWWNGTGNATFDSFTTGSYHNQFGVSTSTTLGMIYTQAAGHAVSYSLAFQPPFSGLTTVAALNQGINNANSGPVGGTGSTTYSYVLIGLAGYGQTAASTTFTISNGVATLSSTQYNQLNLYTGFGLYGVKVCRTAGGATQGVIGTVLFPTTLYRRQGTNSQQGYGGYFYDTGLTGDGTNCSAITNTADGSINLPSGASYRINGSPIPIPSISSCGRTTTCSNTTLGNTARVIFGSCLFSSSTTCTVSRITAFTNSSSFFCTVSDASNTGQTFKVANVSSSSFTITAATSNSDTVNYQCAGN